MLNIYDICGSTNYRLDVFSLLDSDKLKCLFFNPNTMDKGWNSHNVLSYKMDAALCKENCKLRLDYQKRLCCFYSLVVSNKETFLVLYGESTDFPHTKHTKEVLDAFVKMLDEEAPELTGIVDMITPALEGREFPEDDEDDD